jgi:hypothetical protein
MSGWMPMERSSLTECCVGLVLISPSRADERHQREVDEQRVSPVLDTHLTDRLEERQRLDVAHRAADLDQRDIMPSAPARMQRLISSVMCGITCTVPPR